MKTLRTDNCLEFINKDIRNVTDKQGIRHEKTISYTPQQNGRAEREMRTLVEMAKSMLQARNLPKRLWAEAINIADLI